MLRYAVVMLVCLFCALGISSDVYGSQSPRCQPQSVVFAYSNGPSSLRIAIEHGGEIKCTTSQYEYDKLQHLTNVVMRIVLNKEDFYVPNMCTENFRFVYSEVYVEFTNNGISVIIEGETIDTKEFQKRAIFLIGEKLSCAKIERTILEEYRWFQKR